MGRLVTDQTPVRQTARAAAQRLGGEYGAALVEDVEAILHSGEVERRPDQYIDPITISIASLVVSVASLGWTLYKDLRKKTPKPAAEVLAREIRIQLHATSDQARVIEVVVEEITKREPGE
jgi:hypothetical protein